MHFGVLYRASSKASGCALRIQSCVLLLILSGWTLFGSESCQAADASSARPIVPAVVSLDLSSWLSIGGSDHLDRKKYFNIHGAPNELSADEYEYVTGELGAGFGRRVGGLASALARAGEDPARPGHVNAGRLPRRRGNSTGQHSVWDMIDTTHPHAYYHHADGKGGKDTTHSNAKHFVPETAEAAAEAVSAYFASRGVDRPAYFEVANEINVHLGRLRRDGKQPTWDEVCDLHAVVARRLKKDFPQMKVGGPCAAYPAFEIKDFELWHRHMGRFINRAGSSLDFLSVHLYTTHWDDKENYRFGANTDAILDLMENSSRSETGQVIPLLISECGTGFKSGEQIHDHYSPQRDWRIVSGANHLFFSLQKRDDRLLKMVPFIVLKATWYNKPTPYPWTLYHKSKGEWQPTHLAKWYQFWRDAKGQYIPVDSNDANVQAMAVVDGTTVRLYLDNLRRSSSRVVLSELKGLTEAGASEQVTLRRLYFNGSEPVLETEAASLDDLQLQLRPEEAVCIELTLDEPLEPSQRTIESTHYARQQLQPIATGPAQFDFPVPDADLAASWAVLRLSISRPREMSRQPVVLWNGHEITSKGSESGDGQTLIADQFGAIEFPLPPEIVQSQNRLSVSFAEPGGRISTAVLRIRKRVNTFGKETKQAISPSSKAKQAETTQTQTL